jgi:hypothetical protein
LYQKYRKKRGKEKQNVLTDKEHFPKYVAMEKLRKRNILVQYDTASLDVNV